MRVVYVAGPIRAPNAWLREQNVRAAEALAKEVWDTGLAAAICPHAMGRFYDDGEFDKWMKGDLELVRRSDAVLMCPGWKRSQGALQEKAEAERVGKRVFFTMRDLQWWLEEGDPCPPP